MKRLLSSLGAIVAAFGISIVTAIPASAYVAKSCTVLVTARLSTSAWQISANTTRLHMDLNPYTPSSGLKLYSRKILLDGIALKNSSGAYVVNDVYRDRSALSSHTVQGWWRGSDGRDYACSVSVPAYPGY